jgi:hypothetical protein
MDALKYEKPTGRIPDAGESGLNAPIPATVWFKAIAPLLQEGHQFKIQPQGRSMVPFLTGGRDYAVLSAADRSYRFGKNDVVLYAEEGGTHVLHRDCHVNEEGVYTLGDALTTVEGPFRREEILASADYIIRKDKRIDRLDRRYIFLVTIWRMLRPLRPSIIEGYFAFKAALRLAKRKA